MKKDPRWFGATILVATLTTAPAEAQFYGGGFWGGEFGASTVQGDAARGAGMFAMGMGRYNLDTAQANSIDADTLMRWNQYIYESRLEGARVWRQRQARLEERQKTNLDAIQQRIRNAPNSVDITTGNAPNVALDDLTAPRTFQKVVYEGSKVKIGGDLIREIPFQYAAAAISISVQQLTQGPAPAPLRREEFAADLERLKAVADELRKESEETGSDRPETIQKAKDQVVALRAKVEAVFPRTSQEFRDANRYLKALYGFASMLESPAIDVLLAGVDKRPDATIGELLAFMSAYNLRFGVAQTPRQRQVLLSLFPMLTKLRDETMTGPTTVAPATTIVVGDAPAAVFDGLGYSHAERKASPATTPK